MQKKYRMDSLKVIKKLREDVTRYRTQAEHEKNTLYLFEEGRETAQKVYKVLVSIERRLLDIQSELVNQKSNNDNS
jgi:hypothetical protein